MFRTHWNSWSGGNPPVADEQARYWPSSNFKSFGKIAVIYAIGNISARAAGFLLIPLYTHSLSLNEYGFLCTLLVTIQVMIIVMNFGSHKGFMRFANECEEKNLMGELLGSTVLITMVGGCVVTGVCLVFLLPFFQKILVTPEIQGYVVLACLAALFQDLYTHVTVYYRVKNEGFHFIMANLIALFILIGTNVFFLRILTMGVKGALVAQVVTYGSLWLVLFIFLVPKTGLGFSFHLAKRLFKFSFPLLFAILLFQLMEMFAVYLLGYFKSLEQVALYSLGLKIAQIAYMLLILPFQMAYEPFVYGNLDRPGLRIAISKMLTYLMLGYVFVSLGIVFLSRAVISVIAPPAYSDASMVVFLMLPGIGFTGVYYIAESLLGIGKKTSIIGWIVIGSTLLCVGLNYFLIQWWGMYGAILVYNLVQILTAVVILIAGRKVFYIPLEGTRLGLIGCLFVALLFLVYFLQEFHGFIYYSLIPLVALVIAILLYFSHFFDKEEKETMRTLKQWICR